MSAARIAVIVVGLVLALFPFVGAAAADPLPAAWQYACSGDLDPAGCERLTYIAGQSAQADDGLTAVGWGVGAVVFLAVVPVVMRTFGRET